MAFCVLYDRFLTARWVPVGVVYHYTLIWLSVVRMRYGVTQMVDALLTAVKKHFRYL